MVLIIYLPLQIFFISLNYIHVIFLQFGNATHFQTLVDNKMFIFIGILVYCGTFGFFHLPTLLMRVWLCCPHFIVSNLGYLMVMR